jgi:hypothetical protein
VKGRGLPWVTALGWLTLSRAVILAIGFIGVATFVDHHSLVVEGPAALSIETVWRKWDVLWYERIALHGYGWQLDTAQGQAAAAFFPLYPLTVGVLLQILPFASFFWIGSAVSTLCTLAAAALMVQCLTTGNEHARRTMVVLFTAAGSFYFSIPYTEGLFLLLIVGTMVLSRRRAYVWAALLAGLAAVTRPQGLALLAVPAIACWLDGALTSRQRWTRLAAATAIFAVPVAAYLLMLAEVQGSAQAFVERQALWDNPVPYPFRAVVGLIEFPRRVPAYLDAGFWVVYLGLLARYRRRLPAGDVLFCLGALIISTQQANFQGSYRYIAVLAPLVLAVAEDRADVRFALVLLNVIFGTIMILAFVTNNRLVV